MAARLVRHFWALVAMLTLAGLTAMAQTDTVAVKLAKAKSPTERVNLLGEMARALRHTAVGRADSLFEVAVREGQLLPNKKPLREAVVSLAIHLNEKNQVDTVLKLLKWAEQLCIELKDTAGLVSVYNTLGNNFIYRGDVPGALEQFLRSLRLAEIMHDSTSMAAGYSNIGWTYYNNGQLKEAEQFSLKALSIYELQHDSTGMGQAYNNLAIYMADNGQLDSSLALFQRSLDIRLRLKILKDIPWNYNNIGGLLIMMGRPDEGIVQLKKAAEAFEFIGQMRGSVTVLNNIAAAYNDLGRHNESIEIGQQSVAKGRQHAMLDMVRDAEQNLALAYFEKADFKSAYQHLTLFIGLKDTIVNEKSNAKLAELQTQYETEKKQHEIDRLSTEGELKELRIGRQRVQIILLLGAILLVLALSIGGYIWYRQRQRERLNRLLIDQQELRLKAIIEAQEEERKRIAKDLHDGAVQSLTGIKMRFERFKSLAKGLDKDLLEQFDKSLAMLTDAGNEVRAISHQMMPRSLQDTGLVPAIADMLDRSLGSTDIRFEFEHHKVEGQRFAENVEVSIYRICQELINNVIKHSQAKIVSVQLLRTATHLVLVVEDNGRGFTFDAADQRNGIGLMNINSRIKAVN